MDKVTIEMPQVKMCDVQNCGFNVNKNCHAKAITIGDLINPDCDTYMDTSVHTHQNGNPAGVGACKVRDCKFNQDYECFADNIRVGRVNNEVKCLTFKKR